jgi:hypothetical protein
MGFIMWPVPIVEPLFSRLVRLTYSMKPSWATSFVNMELESSVWETFCLHHQELINKLLMMEENTDAETLSIYRETFK